MHASDADYAKNSELFDVRLKECIAIGGQYTILNVGHDCGTMGVILFPPKCGRVGFSIAASVLFHASEPMWQDMLESARLARGL